LQAVLWASFGQVEIDPTAWGWRKQDSQLVPIAMTQQPGPPELMKVVRCNCRKDCSSSHCSCRRNGIHCLAACGHCHGSNCTNADRLAVVDDISENEEDQDVIHRPEVLLQEEVDWLDADVSQQRSTTSSQELLGLDFFFDASCDFDLHRSNEEVVNTSDCASSDVLSV